MKRRSSAIGLNERCTSPTIKRTKVHAQRKFAQGSNNFVASPTKLPKPSESATQPSSPESSAVAENDDQELNNFSNLPTVDDFLTFLCYRETEVLPERLNYLNTSQPESIPVKKKPTKPDSTVSTSVLPSKSSTDQNKPCDKMTANFKSKKKVPEYKLRSNDIKCKPILNKASRSLALKHNQRLRKTVQSKFTDTKLQNLKNKNGLNKFPLVAKNGVSVKVNNLKNHPLTRALSSKKEPPKVIEPESTVKRVTRRNSNLNVLAEKITIPVTKSTPKASTKPKQPPLMAKELSISVENTRIPSKRLSAKSLRISISKFQPSSTPTKPVTRSTRSSTAQLESNRKTPITSSRPTRKTKEAATLYMETLGKDLLRDDESFDEDDNLSIDSFFDLPIFEEAKPKKEPVKSPKKPAKSVPSKSKPLKSAVAKKPPVKQPVKVKPSRKPDKKDKARMEKLNDELKKIVEDKTPPKSKLESTKKEDNRVQQQPQKDTVAEVVLDVQLEKDTAEERDNEISKTCDTLLPDDNEKMVTLVKNRDSIENIEIPEFTIQRRSTSDTECASKRDSKNHQKPRRASSILAKDCPTTKKPPEKTPIPVEKNKHENSAKNDHQTEPEPSTVSICENKIPPKNKAPEKDKKNSTNKILAKTKPPQTTEVSHNKDKVASSRNKNLATTKEVSTSEEKPLPKAPVKNKTCEPPTNVSTSEEKSLPKAPVKNKTCEPPTNVTTSEEKLPTKITLENKPLEIIEKPVDEEKPQSKPPLQNKPLETIKDSCLPKGGKILATLKDVAIPKDNLSLEIPAKTKLPEPSKEDSSAKKESDEKDGEKIASKELKSVAKPKPVDSTNLKLATIKNNVVRKKPKVTIIRSKPKPNEEEDPEEENVKEVTTSGKTEMKKSDTSSCEESESEIPKLLFADDESSEDKTMMQTINASNSKMFCLESKKIIFKKNKTATVVETNEETSPRKTEAFSADNENSVYAFEPDLPTTSPPFRRLKPVTPPKSIISGNSIAVQVNFESNTKIECSSSSEAQVSSTTDCEDRVFYIPIQNSGTNSTLGVAVKLDTDGANQKIIMSATLVTKSPSFTTTTATTVASTSATLETVDNQIEPVEQSDEPAPKKPAPVREIDKIVATADSQTSTQTITDSPSSTVVSPKPSTKVSTAAKATQSVKIVKINKTKKPPPPKAKTKPIKTKSCKKATPETKKTTQNTTSNEILEAPTFYPSEAEFNDPLKYIDTIRSVAEKYGLCRIVPPSTFRPECKVADEMRFTAYNQYIHKMLHRWGPNVKEMMAIKKFLATQNIHFNHPPWIGGMEVDLPRLYEIVQQCGGLKEVIERERWQQVADVMKIPKLAQDRITKLDDIYCKYLLPYDILSHNEREKLFEEIEEEWNAHLKNPNDDDDVFDDVDECIVKGRTMPLSCFYRIARNTMMMCFGNVEGQPEGPSTESIETEFWNHVSKRKNHICVHSGSIDTGMHGYGFSMAKNSTFRKHPWNLKVLTNNSASILKSLGPIIGVTVPTLHVGMLYSACCWYRDPHGLPWIEYLHTGANKIWYGIPDEYSEQFKKAMLFLVPQYCRDKRLWLPSDTIMIPPPLLAAHNVPLSRVVQQPGQFIVVFPKSFTSCISTGYMVSESVYFAHASWLNSAKQIFADMQESCEPSVFSLEQLLISVATDVRANLVILGKILPLLIELRDSEVALRNQLDKLGLTACEKMKINKKRKSKASFNDEDNYECEICRANLFVSLVINSHEQTNYCLKHAASLLQKKPAQVKYCKLMYAYTKEELEEIIQKVQHKLESKGNRKPNAKQNATN